MRGDWEICGLWGLMRICCDGRLLFCTCGCHACQHGPTLARFVYQECGAGLQVRLVTEEGAAEEAGRYATTLSAKGVGRLRRRAWRRRRARRRRRAAMQPRHRACLAALRRWSRPAACGA